MTSVSLSRRFALLATLASSLWLAACGGGGGSNGNSQVRAINLTSDLPSADLYFNDTKSFGALATDTLTDSQTVTANTYTVNVKVAGDSASLLTRSYTLTKDQNYAAVIWGRKASVQVSTLGESEDATNVAAGDTRIRMFNATLDSGTLDVYVTQADDNLNELAPTQASLTSGTLAGFRPLSAKNYRIRVTGAGDPSDVRLDIPDITLAEKTFYTLIITPAGDGGVLLNATLLAQGGPKITTNNTNARVRVVASVANAGVVSAKAGTTTLVSNWRSPKAPQSAGDYTRVVAGAAVPLLVQVNGTTLTTPGNTLLKAGSDYTLLVYGSPTAPQTALFSDDNRVPSIATRAKLRLVNGLSTSSLLSALVSSATTGTGDVASGSVSRDTVVPASGSVKIDVSSSDAFDPIFTLGSTTSTNNLLVAQGVYTIFILDGTTGPVGKVSRDR